MTLSELEQNYKKIEKIITHDKIMRDTALGILESKKLKLDQDVIAKDNNQFAALFLKARAAETRETAITIINEMVTVLIKKMYGDDYGFAFQLNFKALEKGEKVGFNITATITSKMGDDIITTTSIDSRGGGLYETISVLLRWAFLKYHSYNGAILLDETWVSVSADSKMDNLINFINPYIKDTESQVILITHRAEMFGKEASSIHVVSKQDGISQTDTVDYDDVIENQLSILNYK
jgi:hypothetical protein